MSDELSRHSQTCPDCKGKGEILEGAIVAVCSLCKGKGFIDEEI